VSEPTKGKLHRTSVVKQSESVTSNVAFLIKFSMKPQRMKGALTLRPRRI
jgi:hypothetical protein